MTVIAAVPTAARRLLRTVAVRLVADTYVVGSADPFQRTMEVAENDEPFTVIV